MNNFFPRKTSDWRIQEPPTVRRLTFSLWVTALMAGVLVRLVRTAGLTFAGADDWGLIIGSISLSVVILVVLATVHLGNFPVRHWLWRAPLFGLVAGVGEAVTSAALVGAGLERIGSQPATWADWPSLAAYAVLWDILSICLFALVLAAAVQLVRALLLPSGR
jgi:hypothetical protein